MTPVTPPPAGAWVRERWLPRTFASGKARTEPEWRGLWHLASGDVVLYPLNAKARARCGYEQGIESRHMDGTLYQELVVADDRPGVDLCTRCLQLSGVRARVIVRREVIIEA